jgi:hypothetical protein
VAAVTTAQPTAAALLTAFLDATPQSDRVLAGESPARFRRRILLERAAYLMLTTDRTLLDLALDSGFTGQATFATAFRREFGVLPSVWRAEPTTYVIDAPGDVHFHPSDGVLLPARHRMDGVDLVVEMAEHRVSVVRGLLDRIAEDPAGTDRLHRSLARNVEAMEELCAAVHEEGHDPLGDAHEAVPSLRSRLDRVGPAFVSDVARLAASGRLDETVVDAFSPTPRLRSYAAMVAEVLTSGGADPWTS